jgi:hypothetical protein
MIKIKIKGDYKADKPKGIDEPLLYDKEFHKKEVYIFGVKIYSREWSSKTDYSCNCSNKKMGF